MKIISLLCLVASTATASKDAYLLSSPSSLVVDLRGGATRKSAAVPNLQKGPLAGLRQIAGSRQKLPNASASAEKEQLIARVRNDIHKIVIMASVLIFLTLMSMEEYRDFGMFFAICISLAALNYFPMMQKHREDAILALNAAFFGFLIGLLVAAMLLLSAASNMSNDETARGQWCWASLVACVPALSEPW
jgi:hypothetical protein